MNRRDFLGAAAAVTGLAAPIPIRTGILGIQHSHLGGKLQTMYDNAAFDVVSVCEPDEATRRERGGLAMFSRLRWVTIDQMLGDPSIELIVFEGEVKDAVPHGKRIIEAGKHLHLEKPPTNRLEPFRELVEMAGRRKRMLQLGYIFRFHAGVDAALEAFHEGWLGEVFMIRATINADRDLQQRAIEAQFQGGTMFELGGHMIDRVLAFLGRPIRVQPWLRHDSRVNDAERDNTLAVFEYPSALAIVVSSAMDAASNRSLEVIGTDGSVMVEPMEPAPVLRVNLRQAKGPYRKGRQELKLPRQPRFIRDFEDLARAIRSGSETRYSYDHELLLQETLLRASGEIG